MGLNTHFNFTPLSKKIKIKVFKKLKVLIDYNLTNLIKNHSLSNQINKLLYLTQTYFITKMILTKKINYNKIKLKNIYNLAATQPRFIFKEEFNLTLLFDTDCICG